MSGGNINGASMNGVSMVAMVVGMTMTDPAQA
jgi:hypothetical protein